MDKILDVFLDSKYAIYEEIHQLDLILASANPESDLYNQIKKTRDNLRSIYDKMYNAEY